MNLAKLAKSVVPGLFDGASRRPPTRPVPERPAVLLCSTSANAAPDELPPAFRRAIARYLARWPVGSADPRSLLDSLTQKRMQERARAMYGPK